MPLQQFCGSTSNGRISHFSLGRDRFERSRVRERVNGSNVHGLISGRDHARMKKNKMHHVMEDAAEEVLNGLLCHYEPKQKHSSTGKNILRKQRRGKQQQRSRNKNRVRWIDEEDEMSTPPGGGCSVQQACFDATAEMG